jgi:hypothetical protein
MASDEPSPNQTGEPPRPAPTPAPPAAPPKAFATESTEKVRKESPAAFATDTILGTGAPVSSERPAPQPKPPQQPPGPFETGPSERGKKGGGK